MGAETEMSLMSVVDVCDRCRDYVMFLEQQVIELEAQVEQFATYATSTGRALDIIASATENLQRSLAALEKMAEDEPKR